MKGSMTLRLARNGQSVQLLDQDGVNHLDGVAVASVTARAKVGQMAQVELDLVFMDVQVVGVGATYMARLGQDHYGEVAEVRFKDGRVWKAADHGGA